jgi:hypothetical protein
VNGPEPALSPGSVQETQSLSPWSTYLFIRMWAIAHVVHLAAATGSRLDTPWNVAVVLAAAMLLRRPGSGAWLAVLAVSQVIDMVVEMPFSPDHWILMSAVNAVLILSMVARRSWSSSVVASAFPAVRALLFVAYIAAALSKYNTSFLDPVLSCATAIASVASFGWSDEQFGYTPFWAWAALSAETLIPILLAIPVTRRHGVRVGLVFHFLLSAAPSFGVIDFTATLFALFFLFLPYGDAKGTLGVIDHVTRRSAIRRDIQRAPWVAMTVLVFIFGFLGYVHEASASGAVYVITELYLVAIVLAALASWRKSWRPRPLGRLSWFHWPVVVLLLVWAASPYLGLRTTAVFTMFSGLRTEGDTTNHLFMPTFRVVDWQDELVVLIDSTDPVLEAAAQRDVGVPLAELRRMSEDQPDLVITVEQDGVTKTFGPEPSHTSLAPLPWWQAKFFAFRPVAVGDRPFCSNS